MGVPLGPLENAFIAGLIFAMNYEESLLFLTIPTYVSGLQISPRFAVATPVDIAVCSIYFAGVSICFFLSAFYHTVMNHSYEHSRLGLELDYQGIILLMWGATAPLICHGFKYDSKLQKLCRFLLSALATAWSIMTFQPRFRDAPLQRAAIIYCLALSKAFPILHNIIKYGVKIKAQHMGLVWVVITPALKTVGVSAYAIRVRNPTLHSLFPNHEDPSYKISFLDMLKLTCLNIRKSGSLAASISLEPAIRFSILWLSLQD